MRAILIDPEKRTITEIEYHGPRDENDTTYLDEIRGLIGCRRFASPVQLNGSMEIGFDTLRVSDDYMEDRDDPRYWFQVDADRDPPRWYPLAGRGLVVGIDTRGADCDASISIAELQARITFSQRKFRGFEVRKGRGLLDDGRLFELSRVAPVAPIIDGTDEL